MTYLEAVKLVKGLQDGPSLPVLLAMSGTADQLLLFLNAHAAQQGVRIAPRMLQFGTMGQHLHSAQSDGDTEIYLLLPWDLAPECDWRSGGGVVDADEAVEKAKAVCRKLAARKGAKFVYLPAPLPPVCRSRTEDRRLACELATQAAGLGAELLPAGLFSMNTYLASGCPVAGSGLSDVAQVLANTLLARPQGISKVLVTDADNTLWRGLVGEDGAEVVSAEPTGASFRHFIYQGLLLRLKAMGVLLAIVSRNDLDLLMAPLRLGRMSVKTEDFVSLRAGYGAKSEQIRALAAELNLGLDALVFVDDNPVELAEVKASAPGVVTLQFPVSDDEFPAFVSQLAGFFDRDTVTAEDAQRTEMYRRRMEAVPPSNEGDLHSFLAGLGMVLKVRERFADDCERARQLINKTNQFNLNGIRLEQSDIEAMLAAGGRLFTASLDDRTGSHGEILACLLDKDGVVQSLVLSCRVFQRRVEHVFLCWLLRRLDVPALTMRFQTTERNEPLCRFLDESAFNKSTDSGVQVDSAAFLAAHGDDVSLLSLHEEAK